MGNEQGKVETRPEGSLSHALSSQLYIDQKGNYHNTANALKPCPNIYLPESATGPALIKTEIHDYLNYIKIKMPAQAPPLLPPAAQGQVKDQTAEDIDKSLMGFLHEYKAAHKRVFALRIDEENGVGQQADMLSFDYDKKLTHFVKKPEKESQVPLKS